jgi:hypothetical protein
MTDSLGDDMKDARATLVETADATHALREG